METLFKKAAIKKTAFYLILAAGFTFMTLSSSGGGFTVLTAWLFAINVIAILMMGLDKFSSTMEGWNRTPEGTLLWIAFFGGFPGFFLARKLFRHKTKKQEFQQVMWFVFAIQIGLITYYLLKTNGIIS